MLSLIIYQTSGLRCNSKIGPGQNMDDENVCQDSMSVLLNHNDRTSSAMLESRVGCLILRFSGKEKH